MISATGLNSYSLPTGKEKPSCPIHSKFPPAAGMSEDIARGRRSSGRIPASGYSEVASSEEAAKTLGGRSLTASSSRAGDYSSSAPSVGSSAASTFESRFKLVAWTSTIRCLKVVPLTSSPSRYRRMPSRVTSCPFSFWFRSTKNCTPADIGVSSYPPPKMASLSELAFNDAFHRGRICLLLS